MKNLAIGIFATVFLICGVNAQNGFTDDLDQVSYSALNSRNATRTIGLSLKTMAIDYFIEQDPNVDYTLYQAIVSDQLPDIEASIHQIQVYTEDAAEKNPNLDIAPIMESVEILEARSVLVSEESELLIDQIEAEQLQGALTTAQGLRTYLMQMIATANSIIETAQDLKCVPMPGEHFNVRVLLVDATGEVVEGNTGLQGFYAYKAESDQYFYSGEGETQEMSLFSALPEATYTFGAFDGYFDGASNTSITLNSETPVNENGEVEVELIYWSE